MTAIKSDTKRVLTITFPELEHITGIFTKSMLRLLCHYPSAESIRKAKRAKIAKILIPGSYGKQTDESVDAIVKAAATSIGTASPAKEMIIKQKASILLQLEEHLQELTNMLIEQCQSRKAWRKAKINLRRYRQRLRGVIVHHDQDSVYTGHGWLHEVVVKDNVRVSYSENGAKGNVHMESFNGKFKTENHVLFWEQEDFESLEKVVKNRIRYYNQIRRHSALGNKSPIKYLKEKGKIPG